MAPSDVDLVRDGYAAFGRGDMVAVLALLDPDIEWIEPAGYPWGRTYRGHEDVLGLFRTAADMLGPSWRVEPDRLMACGEDGVLALGHHRGRNDEGDWEVAFAMVWRLNDGRAVAFRQYGDSAVLRQVIATARPGR